MSESARFKQTRDAHRTELAEDYVKTILDLIEEDGDAKLTEIAVRFGVAHPSAFKSLRKLESDGLVILEPYKAVQLTSKGLELAQKCRERHESVVQFLIVLGLDPALAEIDGEGIEHHVSEQTLQLMKEFTENHKAISDRSS